MTGLQDLKNEQTHVVHTVSRTAEVEMVLLEILQRCHDLVWMNYCNWLSGDSQLLEISKGPHVQERAS